MTYMSIYSKPISADTIQKQPHEDQKVTLTKTLMDGQGILPLVLDLSAAFDTLDLSTLLGLRSQDK